MPIAGRICRSGATGFIEFPLGHQTLTQGIAAVRDRSPLDNRAVGFIAGCITPNDLVAIGFPAGQARVLVGQAALPPTVVAAVGEAVKIVFHDRAAETARSHGDRISGADIGDRGPGGQGWGPF